MNNTLKEEYIQLEKLKDNPTCIEFFVEWSEHYLRKDPEYMKEIMEQVLEISEENNYTLGQAESLYRLGWYHCDRGNYRTTIQLQLEANDLFIKLDDKLGISKSYNALILAYMELGMFGLSIESGLKALDIADELGNEKLINSILINTSFAYVECERYSEAKQLVERIKVSEEALKMDSKVSFYLVMCKIKMHENQLEEAYAYTDKIDEIAKIRGFYGYYITVEELRGLIAWHMKRYEESEMHFNHALKLAKNNKFVNSVLSLYREYAEYLYDVQRYIQAKECIIEGVQIARKLTRPHELIKLYDLLGKCYTKCGEYKEAYEASNICRTYEKELFNANTSLAFTQLNFRSLQIRASLYEQLYNKLESVSRVGQRLTSNLDIEETFVSIYRELSHLIEANVFGLGLIDKDEMYLDYKFFRINNEDHNLGKIHISDETSLGVYVLKNNTMIHMNDVERESTKYIRQQMKRVQVAGDMPKSLIYCPLTIDNKTIGVVTVQSYKKNAYDQEDISTLKLFATYAAIAIYNGKLFNQVNYLANFDGLTRVLNRREVFKLAEKSFMNLKYSKERLCVIMFDIDYFKRINDEYGHLIGDQVLVKVAAISKDQIKETDLIGRYGGEEFIIFLPNTTLDETLIQAEKIRQEIYKYTKKIDHQCELRISASLGVYAFDGSEINLDEGIKRADEALYQAKQQGKNQVVCYKQSY